jgi:AcrR family transcriptional regulator
MLSKRQQEIVDKSIELISEKGIQGFTIKNLSKSVGISEPAIYRHFEGKVEILKTILNQFVDMSELFSELMSSSDMKAIDKIRFMFEKMVSLFVETPAIISVLFSEEIFKNEEGLKNLIVGIMNTNERTIENILFKGQKEKEIRHDVSENNIALIVMGSLRLMVKRWDLNNHNFDLSVAGEDLMLSLEKLICL